MPETTAPTSIDHPFDEDSPTAELINLLIDELLAMTDPEAMPPTSPLP